MPELLVLVPLLALLIGLLYLTFTCELLCRIHQDDRFIGFKLCGPGGLRIFEFIVLEPLFVSQPQVGLSVRLGWKLPLGRGRECQRFFPLDMEGGLQPLQVFLLLKGLVPEEPESFLKHSLLHPLRTLRNRGIAGFVRALATLFLLALRRSQALTCCRLKWSTQIGFEDAALTGWAAGILWGVKGMLVGGISSFCTLEQRPQLELTPEYTEKRFNFLFNGIFKLRVGHIITGCTAVIARTLFMRRG